MRESVRQRQLSAKLLKKTDGSGKPAYRNFENLGESIIQPAGELSMMKLDILLK
jgi:hypothetical protein